MVWSWKNSPKAEEKEESPFTIEGLAAEIADLRLEFKRIRLHMENMIDALHQRNIELSQKISKKLDYMERKEKTMAEIAEERRRKILRLPPRGQNLYTQPSNLPT